MPSKSIKKVRQIFAQEKYKITLFEVFIWEKYHFELFILGNHQITFPSTITSEQLHSTLLKLIRSEIYHFASYSKYSYHRKITVLCSNHSHHRHIKALWSEYSYERNAKVLCLKYYTKALSSEYSYHVNIKAVWSKFMSEALQGTLVGVFISKSCDWSIHINEISKQFVSNFHIRQISKHFDLSIHIREISKHFCFHIRVVLNTTAVSPFLAHWRYNSFESTLFEEITSENYLSIYNREVSKHLAWSMISTLTHIDVTFQWLIANVWQLSYPSPIPKSVFYLLSQLMW